MINRMLAWSARHRSFLGGIICGILLIVCARVIANHTVFVDWLIAPLILPDTADRAADGIVVLGAGVVGDCVPNQNSVQRVLLAARLWRQQSAPMIFTGGTGGTCPVAEAMAGFAREIGIPASTIHVETASQNTRQNGEYCAPLLRRLNVHRPVLVTDALHMPRAVGTFGRLGFEVERASVPIYVYAGLADNVWLLHLGVREFVALSYYRMRGWVGVMHDVTTDGIAGSNA